ncbi:hypothetical protein BKA67DRAFT_660778 [Truncatella angustata]|uniref:Uncharacterized protein n=1 Tax=Truncatella angustata TaxID=152316 RepID=A0A9P8ZWD9_9PEZI|nr:uncharacterized protein BKA67DRAFT_660778 [Truncatella angustata]KAH6652007.1 hypothetical protein BKA67DRAFT_660778 [Truncatella angustata]KAH8195203.1 hypothetical protein TruAng_010621 [Truncatella angustata]
MAGQIDSTRPFNSLVISIFALFSFAGFYFMRIESAIHGVPINFEKICTEGRWEDGTLIKQTYTGIKAVDFLFTWLVPAFLTGPAGWDEGIRLQQIHFLVNFFAVLSIINIEAVRQRNNGRIISYTAIWAVLYQTVAGAAIVPLYHLAFTLASKKKTYLSSGREVSLGYAKSLLPALAVGYLVPTIAMYLPWGDLNITQNLTALWQPAPAFPNLLLLVLAPVLASSSRSSSRTSDVKHLKRIYVAAGIVSTFTQWATLYLFFTSTNPKLSFKYVFVPNKNIWKENTALGLHYIFLWDFWIIYASSLVWCWVVVVDYLRYVRGKVTPIQMLLAAVNIVGVALVAGPGTAMALVWNKRENLLVEIETGDRKKKAA